MVDVDFILETVITIFLAIYYILEGMVKAILPSQYMPKKDITKDTVLVTGAGQSEIDLFAVRYFHFLSSSYWYMSRDCLIFDLIVKTNLVLGF